VKATSFKSISQECQETEYEVLSDKLNCTSVYFMVVIALCKYFMVNLHLTI